MLTQAAIAPVQNVDTDRQEQKSSDEGEPQEQQQITKTQAVPSSSLQINLNYQSYLLNEVVFNDEESEKEEASSQILPATQKAIKILLQRIISPNAP